MDKSEIKYISLLAPLFYLYGTIFLWSKNAHMFQLSQFAYSFAAIAAAAIILYCLEYLLLYSINKIIKNNKIKKITISLLVAALLAVIGQFCFLKVIFTPYHKMVMWGIIFFIFMTIYFNKTRNVFVFLLILLFFASGSFIYNFYTVRAENAAYKEKLQTDSDDKFLVEFNDKPNIYLFWLESFHGTRTLKNTFNTDISPLITYLNNQNFSVCENMYSSSGSTITSMMDVYSMGQGINGAQKGNSDVMIVIRELLSGNEGNNLLKVLKYNGYITNIMTEGFYYFYSKGEYLDYNSLLDLHKPFIVQLMPSYVFTRVNLWKILEKFIWKNSPYSQEFLKEYIEMEINKLQQENKPYFLAWKGGAFHTPCDGSYTYRDRESWIKSEVYKKKIEETSQTEIPEIVSMILKKDKNALIVILGDHGATTYRGFLEKNFRSKLSENNIKYSDFIDDFFNVFGAVRLPEKYAKFSFDDSEIYVNHQNIFTHIFSLLAHDPEYLKIQKIPEALIYDKVIYNGKPVDTIQ